VSDAFSRLLGVNSESAKNVDLARKSRAWNDSKVNAHHAIVPTQKKLNLAASLTVDEEKVYRLICRNYIAQFLAPHEFYAVEVEVKIGSGTFLAKAKEPIATGWKSIFKTSKSKVESVLRETDGLGTEATRAGIIELLFKRGYLHRRGKAICSTPTGQSLINALPQVATYPDLTALWESKLSAIHDGTSSYQELMQPLKTQLELMVHESRPKFRKTGVAKPRFSR